MGKRKLCDPAEETYWHRQLTAQLRSGLAVQQFCREHDLSEKRFRWWKAELLRRRRQGSGGRRGSRTPVMDAAAPERDESARCGSRRSRESGSAQAGIGPRRAAGRKDAWSGEPGNALFAELRLAADGKQAANRELVPRQEAEAGGALFVELRLGKRADRPGGHVATINVSEDLPLAVMLPDGRLLHLGLEAEASCGHAGCGAAGASACGTDSPIEVLLVGDLRVLVRPGFDEPTLSRLLAVLERRPC